MRKILLILSGIVLTTASAQEHYSGINTSQRGGIINAGVNPAELANLSSKYDIHIISVSAKASNNKLGINDLNGEGDFFDNLFVGGEAVDLRLDGEITGPGIAWKIDKWAFAFTTKAYAKLALVDVDVNLGDALTGSAIDALLTGSSVISTNSNQRMNGTSWGEIALSGARNVYEDGSHKLNVGVSAKLLFPGSYVNFGADQFRGTINNNLGDLTLTDASANLNISYSGNLGDNFTEFNDYAKSLFGKPNGFAVDLGVNYQLKDTDGSPYKLNVGASVRNIGSMTFKDSNNSDTNYSLSIEGAESLDLNQFQDVKSMKDVEAILLASGYLNKTENEQQSFKVNLPTMFTGYADVKVIPSLYVTAYAQFKMKKDEDNGQIAGQNIFSLTPRYTVKNYEVWLPLSSSEISGFATGMGFRAYGFFIGSGSVITALFDSKQADAFIGYGFQLD